MGAPSYLPLSDATQWIFPISALRNTPSTAHMSVEKELYERSRGVEFLYRLGASLQLPSTAMFTAATWFHRFFMRFALEDYHRQDVAAACIFLATKTEECGRKLKDVARVCLVKTHSIANPDDIPSDSRELEECQSAILQTEEALLEALCFDFVVDNPHTHLLDLFDNARARDEATESSAWTLACDSYRTPLCILYAPKIVAVACYVLAQHVAEGPHSPSLDARVASTPPSASLPTPPTHKPASPDASRYAVEYFALSADELRGVTDTLSILLEFYNSQDIQDKAQHLAQVAGVTPPAAQRSCGDIRLFSLQGLSGAPPAETAAQMHARTPNSTHGGVTPQSQSQSTAAPEPAAAPSPSKGGWVPVTSSPSDQKPRLDLS